MRQTTLFTILLMMCIVLLFSCAKDDVQDTDLSGQQAQDDTPSEDVQATQATTAQDDAPSETAAAEDSDAQILGSEETAAVQEDASGSEPAGTDSIETKEITGNASEEELETQTDDSLEQNTSSQDMAAGSEWIITSEYTPDGLFLSSYDDFSTLESLDRICEEMVGQESIALDYNCVKVSGAPCNVEMVNYMSKGKWGKRYTVHPSRTAGVCFTAGEGICANNEYIEKVECSS